MEIVIDTDGPVPLFAQVISRIKQAVLSRDLGPGDALPSARQLSNDLGLSNRTVEKAYRLLERDSVIRAKGRRGIFIDRRAAARLDLEVDNARKTRELEEARELQLALRPRRLPSCPDFEVAAAMITATEVGGDYYDFDVDPSGGLTVAVGDAVGHGARAGALVAATKALFSVSSGGRAVEARLERFDEAFRRMRMKRASVAFSWHTFGDRISKWPRQACLHLYSSGPRAERWKRSR
jgi:GntR family transcriptional regulator